MAQPAPKKMSADEFVRWAKVQAHGRYELVAGEVLAMAPERLEHTVVKAEVWLALRTSIRDGALGCQAISDGMSVRIDDATVYEPDALVRRGAPLPGATVEVSDPVLVVEVLSPSRRGRDAGAKLEDYFRLPSVRHYLLVKTDSRSLIHHRRGDEGGIHTEVRRGGTVLFEPPGIRIDLDEIFGALP